ncbi:MAG: ATP-binding protein, partial [bacterium]
MLETDTRRGSLFFVGYSVVALLFGYLLLCTHTRDDFLVLLLLPVLYAALAYRRRVYLPTLMVCVAVSIYVTYFLTGYFIPSLRTIIFIALLTIALSEISRHSLIACRKVEEELRRREEHYRRFFEEDLTGDFVSTSDGCLSACNVAFARIFAFDSTKEAMNCNMESLYPSLQDWREFLDLVQKRKKLEYHETELRRRDGKSVYVIENVIGAFDDQNRLTEIKGYIFDITKRKELEEQLRQSQKMEAVGRLAGGIAHDFNNLLTAIAGYSDLLLKEHSGHDRSRKGLEQIKKAADRASTLTRQLLAFSRKQLLQLKTLDLNAVVSDLGTMLRRLIGENIELITVLGTEPTYIKADPGQIEQVILNLSVNARDAMRQGGTLRIETANVDLSESVVRNRLDLEPGSYVLLEVSDTGSGMDKETVSHVFEPFFTTKDIGKGTGLGLAMVYGIVKQSGGDIEISTQ